MEHYLDNSATTRVSDSAVKKAAELMSINYGNPSSLHSMGINAERELETARNLVARLLNCESSRVFFTSGGTEANNTALFGAARALKRRGNKIVTTMTEHSSVLEAAAALEKDGFKVTYIKPDSFGTISAESVAEAVDENTVLVSVMTVNNETGAVNDVEKIKKAVSKKNPMTIFHTDAVQAFGKISVNAKKSNADLISVSAHKLHGPKGVGALYIKKGVRISPLHYGGEQEKKIRPGTEALPLIGAFGAAVKEVEIRENLEKISELNRYTKQKLSTIDGIVFNSDKNALPYILNISVTGIRSETMLHYLAHNGIYVSSGSACAKGKPSHVLSALGLSRDLADSAVRISFSKYSTYEDADALAEYIRRGMSSLVKK